MDVRLKRVYEGAGKGDGVRVLVDRLWPRGMTKENAAVDVWLKEVAPSTALRKWFGHRPERWEGFRERYIAELEANGEAVGELVALAEKGRVTLVYGARDKERNQAMVLREYVKAVAGDGVSRSPRAEPRRGSGAGS